MDNELREYLAGMESRLDEKMADRLAAMESRLDERMTERLADLESRLKDHTERVETTLLKEFWKWARSSDAKSRQNSTDIMAINERLSIVEDRLRDLEFGDAA